MTSYKRVNSILNTSVIDEVRCFLNNSSMLNLEPRFCVCMFLFIHSFILNVLSLVFSLCCFVSDDGHDVLNDWQSLIVAWFKFILNTKGTSCKLATTLNISWGLSASVGFSGKCKRVTRLLCHIRTGWSLKTWWKISVKMREPQRNWSSSDLLCCF